MADMVARKNDVNVAQDDPAFHRVYRDALCVRGQERRRVVEAQEGAEEAHGFERQIEEGSINGAGRRVFGVQENGSNVSRARTCGAGEIKCQRTS
jgi:hypothetical protein